LPVLLLGAQTLLIGLSLPRNAVTIDEVVHLPAGLSYWHLGTFSCYHHNPPLIRLLFSLPAVLMDVPFDGSKYRYVTHSRGPDCELGKDFMMLNRDHYMAVYVLARSVVVALSLAGGYLVFRWSRELFGQTGGLISLTLWVFHPEILAHGGLVTVDVASTVVGFLATYCFWHYLKAPSLERATLSGVLLGLAEASKFSHVVLPGIWIALAALKMLWHDRTILLPLRPSAECGYQCRLSLRRALGHASVVSVVSLLVLNDVYLFEGTGKQLGSLKFHSKLLTRPIRDGATGESPPSRRENRFHNTPLAKLPVPLPEHYVLGFDDQMFDFDSGGYYKYLRGELTNGPGWWHYYLYYLLVKTPLGSILLFAAAILALLVSRQCRAGLLDEATLFLPIVVFLTAVSLQRGINFGRYALPICPFLFVVVGRLGPLLTTRPHVWSVLTSGALLASAGSVLAVHPDYLTYFNEAAGGPERGLDHLADSNIDWGQGLVALHDWLEEHGEARPLRLAYFGNMYPEVLGIQYELAPFGPSVLPAANSSSSRPNETGPAPGLQAVSANYLVGIPFPAPDGTGSQTWAPRDAYSYYRRFQPIAVLAHSIYVYDISLAQANRARRQMGLPAWPRSNQDTAAARNQQVPDESGE
jgi:hypothetical protein